MGVKTVPEPDRKGGDRRIVDLVDLLRDQGFAITLAARGHGRAHYIKELRRRGVRAVTGVGDEIGAVVDRRRFDLALLAFWQVGEAWLPTLRARSPRTRMIIDSVDLHFVREARGVFGVTAADGTPGRLEGKHGLRFARELNAYASADRVLTVSEKEAMIVNDLIGDPQLATAVPDFADVRPSALGFEERQGVVFVGNFDHAPNVDGLEHLRDEIVPRLDPAFLERHPVQVVGDALDADLAGRCRETPGIEPVGWVPSVEPYLALGRVSVAPIRFGAGTKRKVIEALSVGTPTVTTSVGAEGLPISAGEEVLVADDPEAFAWAIERLASDEALWSRLANAGQRRMSEHHTRELARARLREAVETTLERPPKATFSSTVSAPP